MQKKLTKRTVDSLAPQSGRLYVFDPELKGFGVVVAPTGRKTYFVEYRPGAGGRQAPKRRYTIGQHGSPWTPDSARDEATRILGLVADKQDPAAARSEARHKEGSTVEEIGALFIERYCKRHQRSWAETERVFRREVYPAIGTKAVEEVTRRDVVRLLDEIATRGPIMANRTLAYVRRFFNWCLEKGYVEASPCTGIKAPGAAKERDRVLADDELAEVWRASEAIGGAWEAIVKLLILTAQRRDEVVSLRWSELDLEKAAWSLPAERTKNKRAHEIPLVKTVVEILEVRPRFIVTDPKTKKQTPSAFVFTTTGRTSVSGFSKTKIALDKAIVAARVETASQSGVDPETVRPPQHWTFHDLRRTATTGMARLGIHPHVADAILNHKEGTIRGVAAVYNRYGYSDERLRALEAWEGYVLALVNRPLAPENVVPLRQLAG